MSSFWVRVKYNDYTFFKNLLKRQDISIFLRSNFILFAKMQIFAWINFKVRLKGLDFFVKILENIVLNKIC